MVCFLNPLRTAMAMLIFKYFMGIRANGFFQSNTAIFFREIPLFYFTRGSSFCITSPNLNVIFSAIELPRIAIGPKPATTDARNLCHLNNCRSANCGWKKVRCKSAQAICIKHCWDCRLFVSETYFLCKKRRQNNLLLAVFLVVENGHFKFCYRKRNKISPKTSFLVAAWGVEISGNSQWWQSLSRWSPTSWF